MSSKFNLKDREKLENVHNVVYQAKCPDCPETYIGETARHLVERVEEHARKDNNSHLLPHVRMKGHTPVSMDDFSIYQRTLKIIIPRRFRRLLLLSKRTGYVRAYCSF